MCLDAVGSVRRPVTGDERSSLGLSVGLLGPLSVTLGDREVVISGARRRDVLIRLVLNEGQISQK